MEFYCNFYKNLLDFYNFCKEKELFYSFDILNDDQKLIRIIVREESLYIRDIREGIDILYINSTDIFGDGKWMISDIIDRISEYKEDSSMCMLIHGRNFLPRCFSPLPEEERQLVLKNLNDCLNRALNFVD